MRTDYVFVTKSAVAVGVQMDDKYELWELDYMAARPLSITVYCTMDDMFGPKLAEMEAWMRRAFLATPVRDVKLVVHQ